MSANTAEIPIMSRMHSSGSTQANGSFSTAPGPPRTSLSSFPPARSPSQLSRPPRSPQPPIMEGDRNSDPSSKSKTSSAGPSSQHSSLSARHRTANHMNSSKKLRSQYPRGATENHVEYILVASFDIDRGPVMEHQFPVAITGDENMLAELMLPDQAHARTQDWTMFFLHKETSEEEEEKERQDKEDRRRRRRRRHNRAAGVIDEEDEEGLEDDMDEYGEDSEGYESAESEPEGGEGPPLIYVLNLVYTKHDKSVKRGGIVKSMAICTRHPFLHIYKVSTTGLRPWKCILTPAACSITRLGRILQSACSGDPGPVIRCCQCYGLVIDAQTQSA